MVWFLGQASMAEKREQKGNTGVVEIQGGHTANTFAFLPTEALASEGALVKLGKGT